MIVVVVYFSRLSLCHQPNECAEDGGGGYASGASDDLVHSGRLCLRMTVQSVGPDADVVPVHRVVHSELLQIRHCKATKKALSSEAGAGLGFSRREK